MDFLLNVRALDVPSGSIGIFWLGQAGFLIKTSGGQLIGVDPYFSDCVARLIPEEGLGFKRLMPAVCAANEIVFDALLISHEHADHFDVDSIRALTDNGRTRVYANAPVAASLREMGLDMSSVTTLRRGVSVDVCGAGLLPVDCDHGALAPEALGFLFDFGAVSLYYAGDTALTPDRLQIPIARRPDVAILPINGAFGNLNGAEAAKYAKMLGCKTVIPCHFWTFPLHHGDPQEIIDAMPIEAPGCELALLCQGEALVYPK